MESNILLGQDQGDSWAEEKFSQILVNYEIPSLVKRIRQQVWFFSHKYRADYVIDLLNNNSIIIEIDGRQHFTKKGKYRKYDVKRHIELESLGYFIIHIPTKCLSYPEELSNYIQGEIERLGEL